MPIGTLRRDDVAPSIDRLIELVKQYSVSSEAVSLGFCGLHQRIASDLPHTGNLIRQPAGIRLTMHPVRVVGRLR